MLGHLVTATLLHATTAVIDPVLEVRIEPAMSADDRELLLAACSSAYSAARCVESNGDTETPLFGRVQAEEPDRILVEVTLDGRAGHHTASRELTFVPEDQPTERAKSIGLTLGVVTASVVDDARAREAERPAESPPPALAPAPDTARWLVALSGGVAKDPDFSVPEWGLAARVELGHASSPFAWRAGVSGFRGASDDVALLRLDPTLGFGARLAFGPLEGAASLDLGVEWLRASVDDTASDDASRVLPLLRGSLALRAYVTQDFGIELTGLASFTTSPTAIFVRGAQVEATSGVQWAGLVGPFLVIR